MRSAIVPQLDNSISFKLLLLLLLLLFAFLSDDESCEQTLYLAATGCEAEARLLIEIARRRGPSLGILHDY